MDPVDETEPHVGAVDGRVQEADALQDVVVLSDGCGTHELKVTWLLRAEEGELAGLVEHKLVLVAALREWNGQRRAEDNVGHRRRAQNRRRRIEHAVAAGIEGRGHQEGDDAADVPLVCLAVDVRIEPRVAVVVGVEAVLPIDAALRRRVLGLVALPVPVIDDRVAHAGGRKLIRRVESNGQWRLRGRGDALGVENRAALVRDVQERQLEEEAHETVAEVIRLLPHDVTGNVIGVGALVLSLQEQLLVGDERHVTRFRVVQNVREAGVHPHHPAERHLRAVLVRGRGVINVVEGCLEVPERDARGHFANLKGASITILVRL